MDELDLLKKHWNKSSETNDEKKMSQKDIHAMLHKNSSSILKTLFYISIFEFILFSCVAVIPLFTGAYNDNLKVAYVNPILQQFLTYFSLAIVVVFVCLLYKSYKSITATASAKKLMESILNTVKTINYYVIYNLVLGGVIMIIGFYQTTHHDIELAAKMTDLTSTQRTLSLIIMVLATLVFIVFIWLFYKLLYGRLTKRLKINYKELSKLSR